jgi:hypothetical protein
MRFGGIGKLTLKFCSYFVGDWLPYVIPSDLSAFVPQFLEIATADCR